MPSLELDTLNQREFRKLVLSIEAQPQRLDLLLAICDDRNLQAQLIDAYETELSEQGIHPFRTRLSHKQPSLRATLAELVEQEPVLQAGEPAVVTVLNAGELLGVRLDGDKSEQERFFFSLQWTREALRQFHFPILLWLPDEVATRLAQQAPDFWSWRSGVFEFVAQPPAPDMAGTQAAPHYQETAPDTDSQVSIADLQQQIADLEATSPDSPLLITLHNTLGEAYGQQYRYKQALPHYDQALKLAQTHQDLGGQARALLNLGDALRKCGRPFQAVDYYQKALAIYRELADRSGEAATLNRLGLACLDLSQYQQAIAFLQQSLEIAREIGDRQGEAASLGNLGNAYYSLGQYQQAIAFHQQYLEIARDIGDRQGEANALGSLGIAYYSLGQYQQAIAFHQQYLEIAREIGDRRGEANSLFNKANVLARLDEKWEAQSCYEAARELYDDLGLQDQVAKCDAAIRNLGQQIVVMPKQAPPIGEAQAKTPSWLANAIPNQPPITAAPVPHQKVPLWVWGLVGLGLVLLLGWWVL